MSTKKTLALAIASSLASAYAGFAAGQESPQVARASADQVLETVVVTAQRRQERLVDVPISITALSSDELLRSGITTTYDLSRVTPGLEFTYNGGFLQPTIRGVSSQGSSAGDSSNVAFYLDGVYQPSQPGQLMDLPDVRQIQVLKGPQGTLYGQNATGGAIIITTVKPNIDELEGKISASYGNYDDIYLTGYATGPLADKWAGSLAVAYQDRDGFRDDLVYGGEDEGLRSKLVRGKLLFQPTDNIDLTLTAYSSDRKDSSTYSGKAYDNHSVGYIYAAYLPEGYYVPMPDWDETATSRKTDTENETWGTSLLADFHFDFGVLSSVTSYSESEVFMDVDADYSFFHFGEVTVDLEQDFFVQELNFVSEQMGRWSFTGGLFYLDGTEEYLPNTFRLANSPLPAPDFIREMADLTPIQYTYGSIDKEIWAAYAEASYELTDRLQLTVGGRYSDEEQTVISNWENQQSLEASESPHSPVSFDQFTPRLTLTYAISDTSTAYFSYGEGFKSGYLGFDESAPVDPEELTAYEIGYKAEYSDSLMFDAAIFYYDYKDKQVDHYDAPDYVLENAADASIQGAEVNATWRATPGLTLAAGLSYLDAEYDEFTDAFANEWNPAGGNVATTIDASGYDLIRSPEVTGFVSADYVLDTSLGEFGAFASAYYNDGYNLELTGVVAQDSYTMLDGELSLAPSALPKLRFVLWGRNLTDEDVLQSLLATPFADGVSYGAPRTFGVRLDMEL